MKKVKHQAYALRLPPSESRALAEAQAKSGQSRNTLIVQCVRHALPEVVAKFLPRSARASNVAPLSAEVLDRIYAKPDEADEKGVRRFIAAQAFGGDD